MSKYALTWGGERRHIIKEGYTDKSMYRGEAYSLCGRYVIPEPWESDLPICVSCQRRDEALPHE